MGLFNDLVKELASLHLLIAANFDTCFFCLFERTAELVRLHVCNIREAQLPFPIVLHRAHERVGDPHRNIEIRNVILVRLGSDKVLHIRMVHPQDGHIGPTSRSALRNLPEGMIVDAQETDRSRRLPRRGLDQRAHRAQA